MHTASTFDSVALRAIRRTFCTRVATPEEICLQLRPRKRSWHMVITGLFEAATVGMTVGMIMVPQMLHAPELRVILETEFWATCLFILCAFLLVFVLLPDAYLPRFELVLRANSNHVLMRGFGVEQRTHGGCCRVSNRILWCNFYVDGVRYVYVDGVRYVLVRRWWQFPFPIGRGAASLKEPLVRAKALLASLKADDERRELQRSADRRAFVKVFGEALVGEQEIALLMLSPAWYLAIGMVGCALVGTFALFFGHSFYSPWGYYTAGRHLIPYVKWMPMWLPTAVVLLCTVVVGIWADPWYRRAVMILPKGKETIRVQVGGRTVCEDGFGEYTIFLDNDEGSYLFMDTRYWSGSRGTSFKEDACSTAIERLQVWTGLRAPKEGSDG